MAADQGFLSRLLELKGEDSDADFARKCGIAYTTMKRYLEGSIPGFDNAASIADANAVSLDWLAGKSAPLSASDKGDLVTLPRYDVRASAGAGALVESEDVAGHIAVGRDWLRRYLPSWASANAVVGILENSGDSMEPTIRDGDMLVVVQGATWRIVERGGVFVFTLDDRLLLKRLQVLDNGDLRIISDNPRYEPMTVRMDDIPNRLILHGYVFFHGGKPRG